MTAHPALQQVIEQLQEMVYGWRAYYGDPSSDHPRRVKDAVWGCIAEVDQLLASLPSSGVSREDPLPPQDSAQP